jgi:hypothetical protein
VPLLVAAACLLPLVPGPEPPASRLALTPPLFKTSLRTTIPKGSVVMLAPMASIGNSAAELWQIRSGMRFRQLGGYMLHAVGPNGAPSYYPSARMLTRLFRIYPKRHRPYQGEVTTAMLDAARRELRDAHVSMVMVGYSRYGEPRHLTIAERLLDRPPDRRIGGVAIWYLAR